MRGYASASTDTGHLASDPDWWSNRAKEIDYGYRGTHVTAVASKALTASFYGKPPQHAYFKGCSNGGRQAMMEVQRYPDDFDGIIAGHPATGTPMQVGRAVVYQHMLASQRQLPHRRGDRADCRRPRSRRATRQDGLADGLITDPRACTFDRRQRLTDRSTASRQQVAPSRRSMRASRRRTARPTRTVSRRPRRRHHRMARVDLGRESAGEAGRRLAGLRPRTAAGRLRADGSELPLSGARPGRSEFQLEDVQLRSRSAAAEDDDRDPDARRHRPAPVQEARRQADHVSRLGRPRHQRARHGATTTSRW